MVPDRGLDAKTIGDAGEQPTPVAGTALRGLAPVVDGKLAAPAGLANVEPDESGMPVTLLFLGVRKDGEKRLLEVYSKEAKPLCSLPLTRKEAPGDRPIDARLANLDNP